MKPFIVLHRITPRPDQSFIAKPFISTLFRGYHAMLAWPNTSGTVEVGRFNHLIPE